MGTKLQASFEALYAALEIPRVARWTVAVLLLIHTGLLAYSAYVHSPTLNEPGHLVAGLSYWKFGRFDVYNVNPPLVKMVAALPVMAVGYHEDWSGFYSGPGARPEMAMGENFVAANGIRSFFLFMIARWACIPFSWLGAIVCYLWARDLYSRPAGVFAAAIWCFEPNILAHASLITSDAAGTALGLAACYTFWRWLREPTWTQAALTGVVLGLAELTKTTLILFYPLWPLMWIVYRLLPSPSRRGQGEGTFCGMTPRVWFREAAMLTLRMVIGLYVLNLGYGFEGSFTQLKQFHFVSDLFTGKVPDETPSPSGRGQGEGTSNRFANSWLGELPVPFPKHYLLGIDIQQKDFEHYGRPSYLRGVWQDHGWWYYYLYAAAIKVPLGLWALGLFALITRVSVSRHERLSERTPTPDTRHLKPELRDYFILLFPALVIFVVVSSKTGFNEHMRYVLPAFPFFYIAIATEATRCLTSPSRGWYKQHTPIRSTRFVSLFSAMSVSLLSCWMIGSSLWIYPHSISYFNESIGGPLNGPAHLLGSNLDWGQDLLYLRSWKCNEPPHQGVGLAYFGVCNPSVLDLRGFVPLTHGVAADRPNHSTVPVGTLRQSIVSVNIFKGYRWAAYDGQQAGENDFSRSAFRCLR